MLSPEQTSAFSSLIRRRINREPAAYITGHKEFFGLDFQVAPPVLIPRPETELLVEKAIDLATSILPRCFPENSPVASRLDWSIRSNPLEQTLQATQLSSFAAKPSMGSLLIADIGTGCGAIAIALAVNIPQAKIYATDISDAALEIAASNCQRHGVSDRVTLLQGSLAAPLPEPVHLIVANLPYVKEAELAGLSPEISRFEPRSALNGGTDGLRYIEEFMSKAEENLLDGGAILLEIGYDQGQAVLKMAKEYFPKGKVSIATDLSGLDRVVSIVLQ